MTTSGSLLFLCGIRLQQLLLVALQRTEVCCECGRHVPRYPTMSTDVRVAVCNAARRVQYYGGAGRCETDQAWHHCLN
jgi:hypothetical protein